MTLDPRTPVLVAAGVASQRSDDPAAGLDAVGLMRSALAAAVADAGAGGGALVDRVDRIVVPEGIWSTRNPGRLVLDGRSPGAQSVLASVGVLQQTPFSQAAADIAAGRVDVVVVCGGEAKFRSLRGQITGVAAWETTDGPDDVADEVLAPGADIITDVEITRLLAAPTHQYAVMESALRVAAGRSPDDHARHVARLVAGFSSVAATNPDAWTSTALTTDEVLGAAMVAEPYTKPCCSQWNVDQAAAFVLCSAGTATAAGIPRDQWVFPVAGAESNLIVPLTQRRELHRSPAARAVGSALSDAFGRPVVAAELREIYSCFPAAVQMQCAEMGIDPDDGAPLTVTGGMHFAGGPLNSFTLQALARLIPLLRARPTTTALLTSISGMVTKVGGGLWSATPPDGGFRSVDVTAEATAATATVGVDAEYSGPATVAGYTIGHRGGAAVEAVVVADTPAGTRAVATTTDPDLIAALAEGERCGRRVSVAAETLVALG